MNLDRSSFYYRPKAKEPDWMKAEADLRDRIEAICLEFPGYGYRRVTYQLKHEEWQTGNSGDMPHMWDKDVQDRKELSPSGYYGST